MGKLIYNIDPSYKKYVLINKTIGKKRLYGKLTKAIHGTLIRAKLFYEKLIG